jgi:membrane-bound ClpP family serine protease
MLKTEVNGRVNEIDTNLVKTGDSGKTVSRLSPAGKAIINDEYFEVHTNGEFIDQETDVIVTHMQDNKIFVKQKP